MGTVGACCCMGALVGFGRALLLLQQQQKLLHTERQRILLLREPLLPIVSSLGIVEVLGVGLCLLLLLQQSFGDRSEEDSLQAVQEMAEREVSAFEFNFNILQPHRDVSARVVSAPVGESPQPWLLRFVSRFFSPLHQLQQQQQLLPLKERSWWNRLQQLLCPPLLPVEGGSSDLPLLQGGVQRLDATLLKVLPVTPGAPKEASFSNSATPAIEPFSPRRLDLATSQYIDTMLREQPRSPASIGATENRTESSPVEMDKRVINRFIGEWEFDRNRSTSMSPITEHLGVPWLVRNAVEKLNPTIEYQLAEKNGQMEFAITTRLTAGISKTVHLNLSGLDVTAEDEDVGAWRSVTRMEGNILKTTQRNDRQKATLYETREIKPDADGTDVLWYNVTLSKEGLSTEISAVRVFKRISGPPAGTEATTGERIADSDGTLSTASSPSKTLEVDETAQPLPLWHSFKPREKPVSSEVKWIVDNIDNPAVFQKTGGRGYETFRCDSYRFHVADGQRILAGESVPVMGVGRINLGKVELQKCIDYLSTPENKMHFDSTTSKVITIVNDGNFSLVYQAFKGQWGFAGREFVIACWNTKVDENRTILSCETAEWAEPVEGQIDGLVRGTLHLAGYDLQRQPNGDVVLTFCVQADLKTAGVPEWINTRVKADQLTVVKCIKDQILKL